MYTLIAWHTPPATEPTHLDGSLGDQGVRPHDDDERDPQAEARVRRSLQPPPSPGTGPAKTKGQF